MKNFKNRFIFLYCNLAVITFTATVYSATILPPLDVTVHKLLGTTRQEEIMLNRIVPYAGAHLGGVHIDTSTTPNRFYIMDSANNRVLGYNGFKAATLPDGPFPEPDIVIGQPAIWDSGTANGDNIHFLPANSNTLAILPFPYVSSTMEAPRSGMMATDSNGNFYLVDLCNNRILKFIDPFTTDQIADDVWGQANFTDRARGLSATRLRTDWDYGSTIGTFAAGVDVDAEGNIWVADSGNSRVLRFPPGSHTADIVLGQTSFTTANAGNGLNGIFKPTGVRRHPVTGELYVLDGQDWPSAYLPRILVFAPPFTSGMYANRQFGRSKNGGGDSDPTGLSWSRGFALDPTETNIVWALDGNHCRIVKFDSYTGAMLDVIGVPTTNDVQKWNGSYQRYNGTTGSIRQPDGDCGFDSDGNFYFTAPYGSAPVVQIPMPLQRSGTLVKSSGEMMKKGMNQISGRTFNDFYGMSGNDEQLYASSGNKILVWTNYSSATTFQRADLVIGQSDFESDDSGGSINRAGGQCTGSNFVFIIADWSRKIYIYETPITNGGRYKYPLKPLQSSSNVRWDDNGSTVPFQANGIAYDAVSNALWISDYEHNRILRVRDPLGVARVDLVLGQVGKTEYDQNHGLGLWTTDAKGFAAPWSLALDNYRNLYIVDSGFEARVDNSGNLRVVRYDAADINPVPGNIFPFPAATGVFGKDNLTRSRTWSETHRPNTPTFVAFSPSNHMVILCDSYGNPQGELVFYYENPNIGLAPQPTKIINTFFGQPSAAFFDGDTVVFQDHTWNRILFHSPAETSPFLDVTDNNTTVYGETHLSIGGTNNENVVGIVTWSNTSGSGTLPASLSWTITNIPLAMGMNLIAVSGTNQQGIVASDTITIVRDHALAFVNITNDAASVNIGISSYTIGGTNDQYAVGDMWWKNTLTNEAGASFTSESSWLIPDIPILLGDNIIEVYGSNVAGRISRDSVVITSIPESSICILILIFVMFFHKYCN